MCTVAVSQSTEFALLVEQGKIGQPKRDPATGQVLKRQPRTGSDVTSVVSFFWPVDDT
jgi:hypothetical protein